MAPLVGLSRPAARLRTVVLPQPEGPSRLTNSPSAIVNETSSSTCSVAPSRSRLRAKRFERWSMRSSPMSHASSIELAHRAPTLHRDPLERAQHYALEQEPGHANHEQSRIDDVGLEQLARPVQAI